MNEGASFGGAKTPFGFFFSVSTFLVDLVAIGRQHTTLDSHGTLCYYPQFLHQEVPHMKNIKTALCLIGLGGGVLVLAPSASLQPKDVLQEMVQTYPDQDVRKELSQYIYLTKPGFGPNGAVAWIGRAEGRYVVSFNRAFFTNPKYSIGFKQSVLAHELIHIEQVESGRYSGTPEMHLLAAAEHEAYVAQAAFAKKYGIKIPTEYQHLGL